MTRVHVVGVGITPFGNVPHLSVRELAQRAVAAALEDAGGAGPIVQAAFFANSAQGLLEGQHSIRGEVALQDFAFDNIPIVNVENACASGATALNMAYCHIKAGASDVALAVGAEKLCCEDRSKSFAVFRGSWDVAQAAHTRAALKQLAGEAEVPAGGSEGERSLFMDVYATFAKFHMKTFGTTVRQFAAVSAKNHRHASLNPNAQYRRVFTIDEVLAARPVAWPLTLPMCAPISDGACAIVLCSDAALRRFSRARAIEVRTSVLTSGGKRSAEDVAEDLSCVAARRAYEQAGLGPADIDVAEVHDATAVGDVQQVENLMLCAFGDGGPLAERGETALGGRIPINPSGGLEAKGHPMGATGLAQIHELTLQLRGAAGLRQVEGLARRWPRTAAGCSALRARWPGSRSSRASPCRTKGSSAMNLAVLLSQAAKTHSGAPALIEADGPPCDYATLGRRAAGLAAAFGARLGLQARDRVALVMRNRPCYIELLFACWHAGLVAVPVNARLHPQEIQFILRDCGARACFTSEELVASIGGLPEAIEELEHMVCVDDREYGRLVQHEPAPARAVRPEAPAWLFYTSGTTGRPKGAVLSHRNLMAMTLSHLADVDQLGPSDTFVHVGPQSHAMGLFSIPFTARGARHVLPASDSFDATELLDIVGRSANVTVFLTPTLLRRLLEAPDLRSAAIERIRTILCGAAPLHLGDVERTLGAVGPRLWIGYGQGESPLTITALPKEMLGDTTHPRHRARMESVGYPRTGVEVRVVDEEDRPVPPGTVGEVVVRGDVVMAGYWNQPKATQETLRGGGWLHTGDLGVMDDDGLLTLKDRCKDLIISGGMNIYSREVEQALLHYSGIREIAVVGAPDREWGERVVAFVVPRRGVALADDELDAH